MGAQKAEVIECANHSVDAYIYKLAEKIGKKVTAASIKGSLWDYSILTVTCEGGGAAVAHSVHHQCALRIQHHFQPVAHAESTSQTGGRPSRPPTLKTQTANRQ